jgi:L-2,4-diaminobutyrate decarboxylase
VSDWQNHFIGVGHIGNDVYRATMQTCTASIVSMFEEVNGPYSGMRPEALQRMVDEIPLNPESVISLDDAIAEAATVIGRHSVIVQHPHCIAHLHTPPLIAALAAERFIAAQNQSLDSWDQSGAATYVEQKVVDWLCHLYAYEIGDGVFTSGGSQGNAMALLVARDWAAQRISQHEVPKSGLPPYFSRMRIVTSSNGHFTLRKSAMHFGLGEQAVVAVPSHADGTFDVDALECTLVKLEEDQLIPFMVVATAGTTDHGAIDDLPRIAALARRHQAWFHVDAAYGGALILGDGRKRLAGIEHADSMIVDFHKLWFQPISGGAFLMKNREHFRHLLFRSAYLNRDTDDLPNLVDKSIIATRRFDALKLWMTLRAVGADVLGKMVDRVQELACAAAEVVRVRSEFELLAPPQLSTVLFRHRPRCDGEDSDRLNRRLRTSLLKSGLAILGETTIEGSVALKMTILNPNLDSRDFSSLLDKIVDHAREC